MPRQLLLSRLAKTEEKITYGNRHIQNQQAIVHGLERGGFDSTNACELLNDLQELQARYIAARTEILSRLEQWKE